MKYCANCGYGNEDSRSACAYCGKELSTVTPRQGGKRKPGSQKLVKMVAAIAAVATVAGGIFAGIKLLGGNTLAKAYQRTTEAVMEAAGEQKGIAAVTELLETYEKQGKYTLEIGYGNSGLTVFMNCDYSRGDKLMDGEVRYSDSQLDLDLDYSVKRDVLQIAIPDLLQDVYGFSVKNLGKKLDKSPIGKLLPADFTALSDVDFFRKTSIAKTLNKLSKGKLDVLKDSVKIEYLDKRTLSFSDGSQTCKMYQVTWDEQALDDLVQSMMENPILSKVAGFLRDVIPQIDGDCRFYINEDGYLVGIDLVSLGSKYFFLMEGETNPWDKFSLTVTSLYGDTKEYNGGLQNTNEGMRLYLQNQSGTFFEAKYNNDGTFSVNTEKHGTIIFGNVTVDRKEVAVELNLNSAQIGRQEMAFRISELEESPKQLAKYYVDLLDMSLADWQRLLLDADITLPLN